MFSLFNACNKALDDMFRDVLQDGTSQPTKHKDKIERSDFALTEIVVVYILLLYYAERFGTRLFFSF